MRRIPITFATIIVHTALFLCSLCRLEYPGLKKGALPRRVARPQCLLKRHSLEDVHLALEHEARNSIGLAWLGNLGVLNVVNVRCVRAKSIHDLCAHITFLGSARESAVLLVFDFDEIDWCLHTL